MLSISHLALASFTSILGTRCHEGAPPPPLPAPLFENALKDSWKQRLVPNTQLKVQPKVHRGPRCRCIALGSSSSFCLRDWIRISAQLVPGFKSGLWQSYLDMIRILSWTYLLSVCQNFDYVWLLTSLDPSVFLMAFTRSFHYFHDCTSWYRLIFMSVMAKKNIFEKSALIFTLFRNQRTIPQNLNNAARNQKVGVATPSRFSCFFPIALQTFSTVLHPSLQGPPPSPTPLPVLSER